MTTPTPVRRAGSRREIGVLLVAAACVLACTVPVFGGFVAGTVFDRVLDAPAWLAVLVAVGVAISIAAARRRRANGRSDGC
jgi:hypothetical protein